MMAVRNVSVNFSLKPFLQLNCQSKKRLKTFYLEGGLRIGAIVKRLQPVLQKKLNR